MIIAEGMVALSCYKKGSYSITVSRIVTHS